MGAAIVKPVTAPIGGWNAADAWDDMPEHDAIRLDNWFPETDSVVTRNGHEEFCLSLPGYVETLVEFKTSTLTHLIAASSTKIYNCSSGTAVEIGTAKTSAQWQTINKNALLIMVNGADTPVSWDGATIANLTITSGGLTSSNLINVCSYRSRVWYTEKNTANVYYTAIDAVSGACTKFPLINLGRKGGYLMAVDTWTRDGGDGADDLIVFIMSSGEVFVYQGDPASSFALIGRYEIAIPVSRRCTVKYGANLWIITLGGVVSLNDVMALGREAVDRAITNKIKLAFRDTADTWGARYGWEALYYPRKEFVLFNVPSGIDTYNQYVVNVLTGAWCKFTGMSGFTWCFYNNNLYFGGNTIIYKADTGSDDDGGDIVCDAITAFNYLGNHAQKKQITMAQVSLKLSGDLVDNITIGTDFKTPDAPGDISISQGAGTPWGSDWGSAWSSQAVIENPFVMVSGWGYNAALRLKIGTPSRQTRWFSTRWIFKKGGLV